MGDPRMARQQTVASFGYKWRTFPIIHPPWQHHLTTWFLTMYGFTRATFQQFIHGKTVLDAGCGMAWRTHWFHHLNPSGLVIGLDAAKEAVHTGNHVMDAELIIGDLQRLPFPPDSFDYIACEGVIHHTPDPRRALAELARMLKPHGTLTLYIYKRKPPIRRLVDTVLRTITTHLSPRACVLFSQLVTAVAHHLYRFNTTLQAVIYQHVIKCFWDWQGQSYATSVAVNFDWYHPQYAHSFTDDDVRDLVANAGLTIESMNPLMSAFAVKAKRGE